MSNKDPYASEAETEVLLQPDQRTASERKLDELIDENHGNKQGAELELVLRQVALDLLAKLDSDGEEITAEKEALRKALNSSRREIASGPWSTTYSNTWDVNRRDTLGTVEHHAVCDAKGKIVAFAVDYSDEPFAELCTDHVALITAAPDMLEVLQDLMEIRDALLNDREPAMTTEQWETKWFAAVSKATGGAA